MFWIYIKTRTHILIPRGIGLQVIFSPQAGRVGVLGAGFTSLPVSVYSFQIASLSGMQTESLIYVKTDHSGMCIEIDNFMNRNFQIEYRGGGS